LSQRTEGHLFPPLPLIEESVVVITIGLSVMLKPEEHSVIILIGFTFSISSLHFLYAGFKLDIST
jgi:hypothetical protein